MAENNSISEHDSFQSEDEEKKMVKCINSEYEVDLLERLFDIKERLDTKRV